ncbi:U2 snRNP-associated SURP motif-containing protein (140 kDa Ser/Arg-rich domain protein) (U2-associated protein SR140) [Durusdinium trenchii]|uniref:U2 snRNP-associated SURP motif-containing protein (140 kDa Ser/Arg-rich domain protein) (U2-associated protein SR140) n=1 Tax=Durusdinium trenchii TaxID=1381693 RepID=A0ABP0L8N5_9DINO
MGSAAANPSDRQKHQDEAGAIAQVLLERSHLFEVQLDSKFQPHVRLISSGVDLSAWSHLSAVCAASAAIAGLANRAAESPPAPLTTLPVEAPETAALGPELLSALEMHLTRRNGHERYSVLRSKFGVKQAQLRPYFQVLPAGHDAVVALCHEPGGAMPKVPGPMNSSVQEAVEGLTLLLGELNTRRCSIGRAMAFCMDRAESHAALLSRRMCSALSEPLPSVEALARFYLVNDVLHNAASEKPGAQQFRESFQDLLPEACEGFGRQWLRRLELPLREPMERRVRSVLHGWETWSIFPRLYIKVPVTLANRAALAAELHRSVGASVVLSGADVSRVGLSEAQAMKKILSSEPHCIPPDVLLLDELACNTIENARNTLAIIRKHVPTVATADIKVYLVTSDFHCPRSEFIFRNVFEAEGAGDLQLESCPAFSALTDDISESPDKEMLSDFKLHKKMKDINEWGIFTRLCHEQALMTNKMRPWLREYGVEKQDPRHFDRAMEQLADQLDQARKGEYLKSGRS